MSFMSIVEKCENILGYDLPTDKPVFKARQIEAAKLKRVMKSYPDYTEDDLELAISYSWKQRLPIQSPTWLVYRVEEARKLSGEQESVSPLERERISAVQRELNADDDQSDEWIRRLQAASGIGVATVLDIWRKTRRSFLPPLP